MNKSPLKALAETEADADIRLQQRLDALAREYASHPLFEELRQLAHQYQRLENKLHKIARISDRMQSQIMEMNQQLGQKAMTDPLTGLLNRRGMYERLEAAAGRLRREQRPFGILLLDLDHFKLVNDSYGHAVGDDLLLALGQALHSNLRVYDSCGRWGGEEFLLLQEESSCDSIQAVARKLLDIVREIKVPTLPDKHLLTVSIGCYLCQTAEPIELSVSKADQAMYQAKAQGRNGLVFFSQ